MNAPSQTRALLRDRSADQRVTNIELFFDLVYVFAVTQLSHHLLGDPTVRGALQTALLLAMVWLVWAYTTWVTNWMDPERTVVRVLLIVLTLVSLAMSATLPRAFGQLGWVVGAAYAVQQVGRSVFMVVALRRAGQRTLRLNFGRILAWCSVSAAFAVAGGVVTGPPRYICWVLAVATDIAGGLAGFWTPGLGRSRTSDWTIEGGHFAERCQAFILIALGESIVIIGAALSDMAHITGPAVAAFVVAFAGSVALWWLYFDRAAGASAEVIAGSDDPGRIARAAYHLIHPVMVAGIIVTAAGDEKILLSPSAHATAASAWMILGGPALFLAGHAAFKAVVWRVVPWTRLAGIVVLALLALAVTALPEIALAACAAAVVAAVGASDRRAGLLPSRNLHSMDNLTGALGRFDRVAVPLEGRRHAAVALAISEGEGGPAVWLTRRARRMRAHARQFALPGGGVDPGEDAVDAAIRELREEIGVDADREEFLGLLDDYATRSGYVITPVVLRVRDGQEPDVNPAEVSELYRITFRDLAVEPRFHSIPESAQPVIQLPLVGHLVHAPTAAVLYQFRELALFDRVTRVAHLEQPVFAWK